MHLYVRPIHRLVLAKFHYATWFEPAPNQFSFRLCDWYVLQALEIALLNLKVDVTDMTVVPAYAHDRRVYSTDPL